MSFFRNLNIGKRFIVAFAVMLGLMVLISITGYTGLMRVLPMAHSIYTDRLIPLADIDEVSHHWFRVQLNTDHIASTTNAQEIDQLQQLSEKELQQASQRMTAYEATELVESEKKHIERYKKVKAMCLDVTARVIAASRSGNSIEADHLMRTEAKVAFGEIIETLRELVRDQRVVGVELYNSLKSTATMAEIIILSIAVLSLLLGISLAITMARSVTRPLKQLNDAAGKVAQGALDTVVVVDTKDEIDSLALSFNVMVASVRSALHEVERKSSEAEAAAAEVREALENIGMLTSQVRTATYEAAQYTSEISTSTEQMAAGAEEQAAQTVEVATAAEEMAQTIAETAHNITITAQSSEQAGAAARTGLGAVVGAKTSMETIVAVTRTTGEKIDALSAKVEEVGGIAEVINEIADQTNLLALNAAIEAARAGEHGRGFAVVADEVRKLAERTTKATKEISQVLQSIQTETRQAHESMEQASNVIEQELTSSHHLTDVFERISSETENVVNLIGQIAVVSEEQSSTMSEVSKTIEGMRVVSEQAAAGVNQIAQSTARLNNLMENLQRLVDQFSSNNREDRKAIPRSQGRYITEPSFS